MKRKFKRQREVILLLVKTLDPYRYPGRLQTNNKYPTLLPDKSGQCFSGREDDKPYFFDQGASGWLL